MSWLLLAVPCLIPGSLLLGCLLHRPAEPEMSELDRQIFSLAHQLGLMDKQ